MWVRIERSNSTVNQLIAPRSLVGDIVGQPVQLICGSRKIFVSVVHSTQCISLGYSSSQPIELSLSSSAADALMLPDGLVWQIVQKQGALIIGPIIGLLLGQQSHRYTPKHMNKYSDRMGAYGRIGGLICAFSAEAIDWAERLVYGLYYHPAKQKWCYGRFPLPDAVYVRNFHIHKELISRLRELTGDRLFNSHRFVKPELYEYLHKDPDLRPFLPAWDLTSNVTQVISFLQAEKDIILKPTDLSRGRGICIIQTQSNGFHVRDYRLSEAVESDLPDEDAVADFLSCNPGFFTDYLMQRYLKLAKIGDSHFDIRLVMQKDITQAWTCSGIECRVGQSGSLVTNISRGGYALTLDQSLYLAFPNYTNRQQLANEIVQLSFKVCQRLDQMGEHFAELGMDIAVDQDARVWIIESNVFPSFKGFKQIDYPTYLEIRYNPLFYALSLSGFNFDREVHLRWPGIR